MKSRQEIKSLAKEGVAAQRGTAILIFLVMFLISLGIGIISIIPILGWLIAIAAGGFFLVALEINIYGSFIKIFKKEQTEIGEPFSALSVNFLRKVGGTWWMALWVFIWSLLGVIAYIVFLSLIMAASYNGNEVSIGLMVIMPFIILVLSIPGIIKGLAYSMTPYILADCPNVTARDALKLSMRMTAGYKGKLFVLGLSFIGWALLSAITFYILLIVYTGPYMYATFSGFYLELKEQAIATGVIEASELGASELE